MTLPGGSLRPVKSAKHTPSQVPKAMGQTLGAQGSLQEGPPKNGTVGWAEEGLAEVRKCWPRVMKVCTHMHVCACVIRVCCGRCVYVCGTHVN